MSRDRYLITAEELHRLVTRVAAERYELADRVRQRPLLAAWEAKVEDIAIQGDRLFINRELVASGELVLKALAEGLGSQPHSAPRTTTLRSGDVIEVEEPDRRFSVTLEVRGAPEHGAEVKLEGWRVTRKRPYQAWEKFDE